MSSDFVIKKDDTHPPLNRTLTDEDGDVDVSSATSVTFHMRDTSDDSVVVDSAATIVNGEAGEVEYRWTSSDTDAAGYYEGEFEVEFQDGDIGTFPNSRDISIQIREDIK